MENSVKQKNGKTEWLKKNRLNFKNWLNRKVKFKQKKQLNRKMVKQKN